MTSYNKSYFQHRSLSLTVSFGYHSRCSILLMNCRLVFSVKMETTISYLFNFLDYRRLFQILFCTLFSTKTSNVNLKMGSNGPSPHFHEFCQNVLSLAIHHHKTQTCVSITTLTEEIQNKLKW